MNANTEMMVGTTFETNRWPEIKESKYFSSISIYKNTIFEISFLPFHSRRHHEDTDGESNQRGAKMTEKEEDLFIQTVLKHYNLIESKKTAPGVTSKFGTSDRAMKENGWQTIRNEFVQLTSVSKMRFNRPQCFQIFNVYIIFPYF